MHDFASQGELTILTAAWRSGGSLARSLSASARGNLDTCSTTVGHGGGESSSRPGEDRPPDLSLRPEEDAPVAMSTAEANLEPMTSKTKARRGENNLANSQVPNFLSSRGGSSPVLPDGFRQNAQENCQNARKNAPA